MCKFETLIDQIKNLKVNLKHGINVSFYFIYLFLYINIFQSNLLLNTNWKNLILNPIIQKCSKLSIIVLELTKTLRFQKRNKLNPQPY